MANNPQKTQDPTEAALSAIQEALNIRPAGVSSAPVGAEPDAEAAPLTPDLFPSEAEGEGVGLRAPANDTPETP